MRVLTLARPWLLNKLPNRFVDRYRVADKVMMSLAGQNDELRVSNLAPEHVCAFAVREIAGRVMLVISDEHEGGSLNLL